MRLEGPEAFVRAALEHGNVSEAVTRSFHLYGAEILGFLDGVLDDWRAAHQLYGQLQGRVLLCLSGFEWRCSLRTWMYALARSELRAPPFRSQRSHCDAASARHGNAKAETRPETVRTCKITELRRSLAPDDLELLVLRIDRSFDWRDLAITQIGFDTREGELLRESERLRQRFEIIKQRIASEARAHGILGSL